MQMPSYVAKALNNTGWIPWFAEALSGRIEGEMTTVVRIVGGGTIGNQLPFEEHLEFVRNLGFREVDLLLISDWRYFSTAALGADYEAVRDRILNALTRYGLKASSMNIKLSVPLERRELLPQRDLEMRAVFRLMRELNIDRLSMIPAQTNDLPYLERVFPLEVEEINRLQAWARKEGIVLCVEPHILTSFCHSRVIRNLIDTYPDFLVTFDPSHFLHSGERTQDMGFIAEHTKLVHLRDACEGQMAVRFGEGTLDLRYCIERLKEARYDGPIVIESMIDQPNVRDVESMLKLRDEIEELWGEEATA